MAEIEQLISMYDSIVLDGVKSRKRHLKSGIIHVFLGGELSIQSSPFKDAIFRSNFARGVIQIEYLSTNDVKKRKWSAKQLVTWLLNCDVHFILSHVHQGLSQLGWTMRSIQRELRRLCFHAGFPSGEQLQCPVFLQDKYRYIQALPNLTNATLRIPLLPTYEGTHWPETISRWCVWNTEKCGWVLKLPYTTNSEFVKFPKTIERILKHLNTASRRYMDTIPYAMLQPCMANRKEYKVVVFNGKFSHVAQNRMTCGTGFASSPFTSLKDFAERAVKELKRADKTFICDGLVRVDIFRDWNGILRVNEFESLEANYYATSHSKTADEYALYCKMSEHWMERIVEHVHALI